MEDNRRMFVFIVVFSVISLAVLYQILSEEKRSQGQVESIDEQSTSRRVTNKDMQYNTPTHTYDQHNVDNLNSSGSFNQTFLRETDVNDFKDLQMPVSINILKRIRDQNVVQIKQKQGIKTNAIDSLANKTMPVAQLAKVKSVSYITTPRKQIDPFQSDNVSSGHCKVHNFSINMDTKDPIQFECVNTKAMENLKICLYPTINDIYVSGSIRQSGAWEWIMNRAIMSALNKYPNASFIDIGANLGMHSLVAAKGGRNVLGVEPKQSTIKRLHKSVSINHLANKITLVENAISNKRATLTLHSNDNNQGASTLRRSFTYTERVKSIVMDDLLEVFYDKEAVMKLDIEGSESRALVNSSKLFSTVKIHAIFMEWDIMKKSFSRNKNEIEQDFAIKMVAYLRSMGFVPRNINSSFAYNSQDLPLLDQDMAEWPGDIVWIKRS